MILFLKVAEWAVWTFFAASLNVRTVRRSRRRSPSGHRRLAPYGEDEPLLHGIINNQVQTIAVSVTSRLRETTNAHRCESLVRMSAARFQRALVG
jgi:hypothetical protein